MEVNRRDLFKVGAAVAGAAAAIRAQGSHRFFTPDEFAMVDEISEILVPADAKSKGGRAAQCADYIDATLAEAYEDKTRQDFRDGLKLIDAVSKQMNEGVSFNQGTPQQRQAAMLRLSENEKDPQTPGEKFFREMKSSILFAYYTTKIGIDDLDYKGNVFQMGQYAGVLPEGPAVANPPVPPAVLK